MWFVPEARSEEAVTLLREIRSGALSASAPELLVAETAQVAWKRVSRKTLTVADATGIVEVLLDCPLRLQPIAPLVEVAFDIAIETGCTVYDAIYLALALRDEAKLVTADSKLIKRIERTSYALYITQL